MSLKETARRAAILDTLSKMIAAELKTAKNDLETGLRAAKDETGTQTIAVDLDGTDIGKATLVQQKPAATVTDETALLAWVRDVAKSEVTVRVVTEIRPAWLAQLKKQIEAVGRPEWADPETGVIHEVPGVELVGRAAHTRLTVPEEGRAAIGEAWRSGALAAVVMPELTASKEESQ
ncbi:hypothetical protein GTY86_35745 [Streptomyces sp. SID5770]|uniref:hypothetical protein n=1 Tax=Streptomyces sp. SID5770 TaxID=2690308 RepID=UPI00136AD294|nr:hypothetical protein [Streptomyces sp. SID5770]MZE53781.1 hypothetical protein [Streptomyces sp. SID5770]MZE56530.1 hypothetical protein [Streptomyces sp. SID5770]